MLSPCNLALRWAESSHTSIFLEDTAKEKKKGGGANQEIHQGINTI